MEAGSISSAQLETIIYANDRFNQRLDDGAPGFDSILWTGMLRSGHSHWLQADRMCGVWPC